MRNKSYAICENRATPSPNANERRLQAENEQQSASAARLASAQPLCIRLLLPPPAMQTANVSKMFRNLVFPLTELGANRPKRTASSRKKQLFTQFNVVIGNA